MEGVREDGAMRIWGERRGSRRLELGRGVEGRGTRGLGKVVVVAFVGGVSVCVCFVCVFVCVFVFVCVSRVCSKLS